MDPSEWVDDACRFANRLLTDAEMDTYQLRDLDLVVVDECAGLVPVE